MISSRLSERLAGARDTPQSITPSGKASGGLDAKEEQDLSAENLCGFSDDGVAPVTGRAGSGCEGKSSNTSVSDDGNQMLDCSAC